MKDENKAKNGRAEIERANEALLEAKKLVEVGLIYGALSRAYYAVFHAVRALLFSKGLQSKTHEGLRMLFDKHFIQTKTMERKFFNILTKL